MSATDEAILWDRLSNARRVPLNPVWLGEVYSPGLSSELRFAITERLGMFAESGWPIIKNLTKQYGVLPEFIHAAGLCHQSEARDWLLEQLKTTKNPDVPLLNALSCWGAELTISQLDCILRLPGQAERLAALNLLSFKSHQLTASELLYLCENILEDWRDPVVIACIRVLQRRNEQEISDRITKIVLEGSDLAAQTALKALGCMVTAHSKNSLRALSVQLADSERRKQALQQLQQQF